MTEAAPIARLRRWRARLLKVYVFHVGWLTSTCAFAATGATHATVATTLWLTLVTIPPVLIYTVIVHRACRAVDPSARSVGAGRVIFMSLFLTPLESGLVLPAKNLLVATRLLRRHGTSSGAHPEHRRRVASSGAGPPDTCTQATSELRSRFPYPDEP